jgi:hypothetical protein
MTNQGPFSIEMATAQLDRVRAWVSRPHVYYSRAGVELSHDACAEAFRSMDTRQVAVSVVRGWRVSTCWIGVDHGPGQAHGGPPVAIFETMVFRGAKGSESYATERYATEADALAGHERHCQRVDAVTHEVNRVLDEEL